MSFKCICARELERTPAWLHKEPRVCHPAFYSQKKSIIFPGTDEERRSREETWKLVEFYKTALGSRTWTKAAAKLLNTEWRSQPEANAKEQ